MNGSVAQTTCKSKYSDKQPSVTHINADVPILKYALRYAELKRFPIPVHVPIIHEAGRVGCSCEAFKRSEKYQTYLVERGREREFNPKYECRTPGKHPIGMDWETKASNDPNAIRQTFRQRTTTDVDTGATIRYYPNIGWAAGPAGLLMFDHDSYKDTYGGAALIPDGDEETERGISQSGGTHLWYDRQSLPYGNDTGDLPEGVDVRGIGGQALVEPSLGPTGNRYQWELDCAPGQISLRPIPDALKVILEQAHQEKQNRQAQAVNVKFGAVGERPDLGQWNLPGWALQGIANPAPKGKRSEHDFGVSMALCRADATDDDILAVFSHYPVGVNGKFAEEGAGYLARTITNARAARAAEKCKAATVNDIIEHARWWIRRSDFAEVVPLKLQASNGYRTNDTDKAMALACLAILGSYGKLEGPIGLAQLSEATGRSLDTCRKAMHRIAALFPCTNEETRTPDQARCYRLCDVLRRSETVPISPNCEPFPIYATLPMDTHRAHDAFVRSMTPLDADELARRIEWRKGEGKRAAATGDERRRVTALLPSAGPAALVVVDALTEFGPLRGVDLVALTCKKKYSISRAVRRLKELELVEVVDGAVTLVDGWADRLNEITPQMPTAGTTRRRTIDRIDRTIAQCENALENAGADQQKWLWRRLERARKRKVDFAKAEGFSDLATIKAVATGNHSLTWWDAQKIKRRDEMHAKVKMDEAEKRRAPEWELAKLARQMRTEGQGKRDFVRQAEYAGYTASEAWEAAHRVWASAPQEVAA